MSSRIIKLETLQLKLQLCMEMARGWERAMDGEREKGAYRNECKQISYLTKAQTASVAKCSKIINRCCCTTRDDTSLVQVIKPLKMTEIALEPTA